MDVRNIKNPKFIKKLKINELEDLSNNIRKYIIDLIPEKKIKSMVFSYGNDKSLSLLFFWARVYFFEN